jgi:hypothetical protein
MERVDLFSVPIWKTKLHPSEYNRAQIIKDVEHNYAIDPKRNAWDSVSNMHHTNCDYNNPKFKEIDTTSLRSPYHKIISEFINTLKFAHPVQWGFGIDNITAMKSSQNMNAHDHTGYAGSFFSMVHYLQFDKNHHSTTTFINPSTALVYHSLLQENRRRLAPILENSSYFPNWNLETEEHDVVIFPSYLRHRVDPNPETNKLRITGVVSISIT